MLLVSTLCLAAQLARASILAVVDERSTTSTFDHLWRSLEGASQPHVRRSTVGQADLGGAGRGHDVVVSGPQEAGAKLRLEGDRFEHLVVFAPSAKGEAVDTLTDL